MTAAAPQAPGHGPGDSTTGGGAEGALMILAGGGQLPRLVADGALARGRRVVVVVIDGHGDAKTFFDLPHVVLRLGDASAALEFAREHGVTHVVMAGAVKRPSLSQIRPDALGTRLIARIGLRSMGGDDRLLRAIRGEVEALGFQVCAPSDFADHLRAPPGVMGACQPDDTARIDIARGVEVARHLGQVDVGQTVVVQQGVVLAVEAAEGTDALIVRCPALARPGARPVMVKIRKPGQDRHLDLPTVGVNTVELAAAARFAGIAVEAGGCLMMDRDAMIAQADRAGLFLIGVDVDSQS